MKYLILQNTTAPYRTSLFNKLYAMGLDLKLFYMCELEKDRSWKIDYDSFQYPYYVDKGLDIYLKGLFIHWNPKMIRMMRRDKQSKIILGGSWNALDVIAFCTLKRMGILKQEIIFWSEANYLTIGARKKNFFRDKLRSYVYNTGEGRVIVPGKMAEISFKKWGIKNKTFIRLPNVIEESKIKPNSEKTFTEISQQPHFIMPVRLNERIKGIMNFFKAIGPENVKKAVFDVLGNGEDEALIKAFVLENGYSDNILLHGFCNAETVNGYYNKCDAIILPSFSDPSPLSLVEACCNGLPVLASERCGNHYETVVVGENGYVFDPENHEQVKNSFELFLQRRQEWNKMGEVSRKLFEENFKQSNVLPRFITELQS